MSIIPFSFGVSWVEEKVRGYGDNTEYTTRGTSITKTKSVRFYDFFFLFSASSHLSPVAFLFYFHYFLLEFLYKIERLVQSSILGFGGLGNKLTQCLHVFRC